MTSESPAGGMTDTVSTPKFLPCPWCAGAADLYDRAWGKCRDCGAEGPVGDTPEEAIRLWNTRSPDIAAKVRTEALREAAGIARKELDYEAGPHGDAFCAQACQAILSKIESLITIDAPDSGVSIDATEL